MNYSVVWNPDAENDLTQMWLASRMRHAIRAAADEIDSALVVNPLEYGESRDESRRVMYVWPLGVSFEVDGTKL